MASYFQPPDEKQRLSAIGLRLVTARTGTHDEQEYELIPTAGEDSSILSAIKPYPEVFQAIPTPGEDDWLANHHEDGQMFSDFCRSWHNTPRRDKDTIYILPLTFFEKCVPPDILHDLASFAGIFFGVPVQPTGARAFADKVPSRFRQCGPVAFPQVHAGKILRELEHIVPANAFCIGAITLCDLYPRDSWNFVFGIANLHARTGVYSLARYLPGFPDQQPDVGHTTKEERSQLLVRSCRLMCHEICHMFGIGHCIYFHCLMNGSNHFVESDQKPLHLCPMCLRKLHHSVGFDVPERYQKMLDFCRDKGMQKEAAWFEKRVVTLPCPMDIN